MSDPTQADPTKHQVTQLLQRWGDGDADAMEQLMPLVYNELRGLARRYLRKERQGHPLETSALVHEAYVKLIDQTRVNVQSTLKLFPLRHAQANDVRQTLRAIFQARFRSMQPCITC